jgi:hypothetical protein
VKDWDEPVAITRIGTITDTKRMQMKMADGQINELLAGGYEHLNR